MARQKRIWYPGATYHVMSRGNRRSAIYKEHSDYVHFLEIMRMVKEKYPFTVHSICLMTNHFHMSIETGDTELWKLMQKILSVYAEEFSALKGMPSVLYTIGDLRINDYVESVGIVGARRCIQEGKNKSIEVTSEAVSAGKAVISGMAKGIDSYAHTAAIRSGGYTIAVLGSGPDICYPQEHQPLYSAIAQNGCIVSEYPPGTRPAAYRFPQRNRLIAALCDELYIIGAGRNSGTGSTVAYAGQYGRKVIVIPEGIGSSAA